MTDRGELSDIRRLISLVKRAGIGELEFSARGRTVRITAHAGTVEGTPGGATGSPEPKPAAPAAPLRTENLVAISSPMVGTFYRAPAPDADPYVEVGDMVETGQTVCIIEAMKLMNEIESEVRGRVARILVENAQPVEFGQKLFLIDPAV